MDSSPITCAGCSRPVPSGGLILISAAPLPLRTGAGADLKARALKAAVLNRDGLGESRDNVYCGKACALARLSDELDLVLGITPTPDMRPEPEAEGLGRLRHIPCKYSPNGCALAYRRRVTYEGTPCMDVLTCAGTHTAVADLVGCPLNAGCTPSAASRVARGSDATASLAEHPHPTHPDAEEVE